MSAVLDIYIYRGIRDLEREVDKFKVTWTISGSRVAENERIRAARFFSRSKGDLTSTMGRVTVVSFRRPTSRAEQLRPTRRTWK
jgi:hypothetical protein